MARLEVRGGTMDIVSVGEGPDLVLLHSLLIDRSAFARIVPESTKDRRVHLVVLPGFDASSPAGPGVEDHADRIAEALRALGLGPGGAVLGNGFGGFVVAALAAPHGALFEKLLLVDTAARFPQQARSAFAVMAEKVAAGGMEAVAEIAAWRIFHDAYLAAYAGAVAERRAVLIRFNPDAFIAASRALERIDLRSALSRIKNPTLVMVGELDAAPRLISLANWRKRSKARALSCCQAAATVRCCRPFWPRAAPFWSCQTASASNPRYGQNIDYWPSIGCWEFAEPTRWWQSSPHDQARADRRTDAARGACRTGSSPAACPVAADEPLGANMTSTASRRKSPFKSADYPRPARGAASSDSD